jgi:hypothetical protein
MVGVAPDETVEVSCAWEMIAARKKSTGASRKTIPRLRTLRSQNFRFIADSSFGLHEIPFKPDYNQNVEKGGTLHS